MERHYKIVEQIRIEKVERPFQLHLTSRKQPNGKIYEHRFDLTEEQTRELQRPLEQEPPD